MSVDPVGTLRIVFEDDQWGSMIAFEPGILVSLDGTLELLFDDEANPSLRPRPRTLKVAN